MKKQLHLIIGCLLLSLACNLPFFSPTVESTPTQAPPPSPGDEPTSQSSPTATPEPPPPYFTEEFDIPSPYWQNLQAGGSQPAEITTSNGALQILHNAPDTWLVGVHVVHSYSNVFVRAKISLNGRGSAGLICRYSEIDGWYEFDVAGDGAYYLLFGQWLSPGIAKYIPMISGQLNLPNGMQDAEIGLFCNDGFLDLHVNGTRIRGYDATNYGLTKGNIGFATASFTDVPMTASIEWVSVADK